MDNRLLCIGGRYHEVKGGGCERAGGGGYWCVQGVCLVSMLCYLVF